MEGDVFVVKIIDKPYKLKVKADDESVFEAAQKEISSIIETYSSSYGIKDKQDLLSMALLHFATELVRARKESIHNKDINTLSDTVVEELMEIDSSIEELIKC